MAIYTDLSGLFASWADMHRDYDLRCWKFARRFATSFGKFVGAPDFYQVPSKPPQPYMEAVRAEVDEDGNFTFVVPDKAPDVIIRESDGRWLTALSITLEREANAFPKGRFRIPLRFSVKDEQVEMTIVDTNDTFAFEMDNAEQMKPIFERIVSHVKNILGEKPWETTPKPSIGFLGS